VEVVEGLLRDLAIDGDVLCRCEGFVRAAKYIVTGDDLGDIAGHQLDARLGELRAALIVDGDPANQIGLLFNGAAEPGTCRFLRRIGSDHVIGGFPTEAAGDVGKLAESFCALSESICQRRVGLSSRPSGDAGKSGVPGSWKRNLPSTSIRG